MRKDELDDLKAKYKLWRVLHLDTDWFCGYCKHQGPTDRDWEHCEKAPSFRPQKNFFVCLGFLMEGNYVEHV